MRVRIELVFLPLTLEGVLLSKCGSGMERVAIQSFRTGLVQLPCRKQLFYGRLAIRIRTALVIL